MKHIILRPIRESDRAQIHAILTDRRISRTYMLPDFENTEAVERLFQRFVELCRAPDRFVTGMDLDGELVGFLNDVGTENGIIELGYAVAPDHWGRGCCTEGLKLAMETLFSRDFREVRCGAFEENIPSIRVMEKAGMEKLPLTEAIEYRGVTHNCVYYAKKNNSM